MLCLPVFSRAVVKGLPMWPPAYNRVSDGVEYSNSQFYSMGIGIELHTPMIATFLIEGVAIVDVDCELMV